MKILNTVTTDVRVVQYNYFNHISVH